MKALVTGGAGFIGSHLSDSLIDLGFEVVILDNLKTGKESNINSKARFYLVDIVDQESTKEIFFNERPDLVFHLAAQSFVSVSVKDPLEDARINVLGSLNLLMHSKDYNVKKFIYSNSGGASYGNPTSLPIQENHPINPICPYGISKHTLEHYLFLYSHNYGLKYSSLRYANIFGPRQDPFGEGGVVSIFINKLINNERPTIFGDGTQIRDYCFVKDVVGANLLMINGGHNKCYNVGTGVGTSTQEVFETIRDEMDSSLEPQYAPERIGDAKACVLDSSLLFNDGWRIKYSFKQGITNTVNYFKSLK